MPNERWCLSLEPRGCRGRGRLSRRRHRLRTQPGAPGMGPASRRQARGAPSALEWGAGTAGARASVLGSVFLGEPELGDEFLQPRVGG